MTSTNDGMYDTLMQLYPDAADSLGDLLEEYWEEYTPESRASRQYEHYSSFVGSQGTTVGDLAYWYWNDKDTAVINLEVEDGNDLLLEDGSLILLEGLQ